MNIYRTSFLANVCIRPGIAIAASLVGLIGCASAPPPADPTPLEPAKIANNTRSASTALNLPDWYLNSKDTEANTPGILLEAASANDMDVQLALDKAILDAQYRIAERIRSQVSGETTQITIATRNGDIQTHQQQAVRVSSSAVNSSQTGYYRVLKQSLINEFGTDGAHYRAFVLVEYRPAAAPNTPTPAITTAPQP